jgi:hypothetical protein
MEKERKGVRESPEKENARNPIPGVSKLSGRTLLAARAIAYD